MRFVVALGIALALASAGAAQARSRHLGHRPRVHHASFKPGKAARGFPMPRTRHPRL